MEVPVLVLDVDEREAAKLLALIDPLAGMAEADAGVLAELLATVDTENAAVQELLDRMLADAEVPSEEEAAEETPSEVDVPEVFQVVIECGDEQQQREVYERLLSEGLKCKLLTL